MHEKGKYARDYFNRNGELRHIKKLRFWPLDRVLSEKYHLPEHEVSGCAVLSLQPYCRSGKPCAARHGPSGKERLQHAVCRTSSCRVPPARGQPCRALLFPVCTHRRLSG